MTPRRRGTLAITTVCLSSLVLVACGSSAPKPEGGQSRSDAAAAVEAAGFDQVEVTVSKAMNGFQSSTTTNLYVAIPSGATVEDPPAVVEFLLRTAWSVSDQEPTRSITVGFKGATTPSDWVAVGTDAGLPLSDLTDQASPSLDADDAAATFGPWPGDVPELPAGAMTRPR